MHLIGCMETLCFYKPSCMQILCFYWLGCLQTFNICLVALDLVSVLLVACKPCFVLPWLHVSLMFILAWLHANLVFVLPWLHVSLMLLLT
jgi:hypothetical protein